MKRFFIHSALLCALLAGCTVSPSPETENAENKEPDTKTEESILQIDTEALYNEIIQVYVSYIEKAEEERSDEDPYFGIYEALIMREKEDVLENTGYGLIDLNNDGKEELLIGIITDSDGKNAYGSDFYALFTIVSDTPVYVIGGTARNRYAVMDDMRILNTGSGGALYSCFGTFKLNQTGQLECEDFYFTDVMDDDPESAACFHNTSGEWDKTVSEMMETDFDAFFSIEDTYLSHRLMVPLTPLSQFGE